MTAFTLSAFADEIDSELKTQMDVLETHGIKYIEVRGVGGRNITQHSISEVRDIKRQLYARGFRISAIGSPIGKIFVTDDFRPHMELFKHTLEIAAVLEAEYIRMFSFFMPKGDSPADHRDEVMKRWCSFIDAARGSGLVLLHENEKDIYGDTPERCLDLLKTMDCSYLKAVFDPANFVQCDVETYPGAFEMLKDYIAYMHIKDARFKDHGVVPSGYGVGRVKDILSSLKKSGFCGFLSLEPHLGSFTGFSELEHGDKLPDLPKGGPELFGIAAEALKKLLAGIGN